MGEARQDVEGKVLDINMIQKIIPHRYPFLLVDKITSASKEASKVVGLKNVTINEPYFQGHFPGNPIMPGVLIIEAIAQVGGVGALNLSDNLGKLAYFMSIDNARFRKPVVPGDQLIVEATCLKSKMNMMKVHGVAKVNGEVVAEADLMFAFVKSNE